MPVQRRHLLLKKKKRCHCAIYKWELRWIYLPHWRDTSSCHGYQEGTRVPIQDQAPIENTRNEVPQRPFSINAVLHRSYRVTLCRGLWKVFLCGLRIPHWSCFEPKQEKWRTTLLLPLLRIDGASNYHPFRLGHKHKTSRWPTWWTVTSTYCHPARGGGLSFASPQTTNPRSSPGLRIVPNRWSARSRKAKWSQLNVFPNMCPIKGFLWTKRSLLRNYPTCKERLCNSNWELCRIHRFLPHRFQPPVEHCGPLLTSAPRCRTTRDYDDDNYENYKRGWTATDASVGMTPMWLKCEIVYGLLWKKSKWTTLHDW